MLELRLHPTIRLEKPPRKTLLDSMPLLQSVFLSPGTHHAHGEIVAFTTADDDDARGGGRVVQALALQLAALTEKRVLIAHATSLQGLGKEDSIGMLESCSPTDNPNVWVLTDDAEITARGEKRLKTQDKVDLLLNRAWKHNPGFGRESLEVLKQTFDFILIDCEIVQEAAIFAPIVDGVVVIVAANRTRRSAVSRAQQTIEETGGKIAGFVLDRYRRPLPRWLDKRL